jgi:hypothetical protein
MYLHRAIVTDAGPDHLGTQHNVKNSTKYRQAQFLGASTGILMGHTEVVHHSLQPALHLLYATISLLAVAS